MVQLKRKFDNDRNVKRGREELRRVTRTASRKHIHKQKDEETDKNDEKLIEEEKLVNNRHELDDEDEDDDEKSKAYSALLTLLKTDHTEKKTKDSSKEIHEENEEDDNVAGINMEQEQDEEEEEEEVEISDDEDSPVGLAFDPFEVHFNQPSEEYLSKQEKSREKWKIMDKKLYEDLNLSTLTQASSEILQPPLLNKSKIEDYGIKKRVLDAFTKHYPNLSQLDKILLNPLINYQDINYQYKSFKNISYRKLYLMHVLNHVYKTRDRILKNTAKLHSNPDSNEEFKDQGFTRPKILILLPTRESCFETVEELIKISGTNQQENKKKFTSQFHVKDSPRSNKPDDFKDAFKGNNNDFFCIGLKFTRKSLKLYSSFYSSDIIIASPIGLSMILENPDKKKRQYDFLSSIEILIVDKSNQIEMQNWDHINTVMKYINKIPKDFHDADFSRIRMWSINDQAKYLRQNLIFCEYLTPNINNLISSKSFNLSGKVKVKPIINPESSIMNSIGLKIKQIFQRFDTSNTPINDSETRFKFFINSIVPNIFKNCSYEDGIMIFIPSYFDYLRVKNFLKTSTKLNFGSIDEYSSQSKLSKMRHEFATGKIKILLYTERLHYFRRYEINGVKSLIMYQLPQNPIFYKELIRFIGKSIFKEECDLNLAITKILFSKWDAVTLERIVGNERAPILCNSVNDLYEFK
ncbi:unnamed protein product [Candida verbasci]|uniref:U3 small nucleolar RNA-associated protein 25 n=1 Tax=Candida verbasci TaxID=1227364 RepID=A0A9W4TPY4_9ASCO|nr:unnamed protein product [Candida verbasci]